MPANTVIMWFRQDLRLSDNPALLNAIQQGRVLPVFILDEGNDWSIGGASRWWLHHSLLALNESLQGNLWILRGDAAELLLQLAREHSASHAFWNRCYEPSIIRRDSLIKEQLTAVGITATSSNGSLIWEPWENLKQDGTPYKIFTPFYKYAIANNPPAAPSPAANANFDTVKCLQGKNRIDDLNLLPEINWYEQIASQWQPGELGARQRLQNFTENGLYDYRDGRDYPAKRSVSMLSPHLHFGEISPREAASVVKQAGDIDSNEEQAAHFIRELAWREFSYYTLYHFPHICQQNMKSQFDRFPWVKDQKSLCLWQQGQTGFPLVDAGMRELWQTGTMHNRVRMIVGSFLVKNLMIHWLEGARWFWDCLLDADLANNSCSWQWVAGSGADAAPYFRIFNPVTQSTKFDPEGSYIRKYVPELNGLSNKAIHDPSSAAASELEKAGVILGEHYPRAIVDLKESRVRALDAYKALRDQA
jgi:deoxyribodipyrimidine photo-lyase|tara:strand:- start:6433 stop:7860 length:1428 start_codon:yes stop_codon:yes gene_type:complete